MSAGKVFLKIFQISFSIAVMALIVFALYRGGVYAYEFGYRVFTEAPVAEETDGKDKLVQITGDMGAKDIGDLLERKGLIRSSSLFVVQLKLSAYSDNIKEGTYALSTAMTAQEMMQVMSAEEAEDTETEE